MTKSILAASLLVIGVEAGSNFADSLAECSAVQELNICLRGVGIRILMIVVDGDGGNSNDNGDDGGGGGGGDGVSYCCFISLCFLGCKI